MRIPISMRSDFGRRLIPTLIDVKARSNPQEVYCYIPWTLNVENGFRTISYRCLANAIDTCAWWLEAELGRGQNFATLAYLGPSDLRNIIIILAAIKTGHKALLVSPRNSLEAHHSLLDSTGCAVMLTTDPPAASARDISKGRTMRQIIVPEMDHWLDTSDATTYRFNKTFDQARYDPFVVVHTSGSTGMPKAVVVNHGTLACCDAFNYDTMGKDCTPMISDALRDQTCFVSMPLFHIAGIDFMLPRALYQGLIPVLGPPGTPVTAELVDKMHQLELVHMSVVAPSILQDIAASPSFFQNLRQVKATMYGGGPLPPRAGDAIASRTRLFNFMGSSEMASIPTEQTDGKDWEYFKFSPKLGYEMHHHSGGLFELCFSRDPQLDLYQSVFSTFPDRQEYCTNDLYSMHATRPGLWKYEGRADDIIALTNGEKINPINMENRIAAHPEVNAALVIGQARFEPALLIEAKHPPSCDIARGELLDMVWPTVHEANMQSDSHARISKDRVLFTVPGKPFSRAGKGTVQRRVTIDDYQDEINETYDKLERLTEPCNLPNTPSPRSPTSSSTVTPSEDGFENWLQDLLCGATGWARLDPVANFFSLGMDSLQVLNVVRAINAAAADPGKQLLPVTAKAVYSNPTFSMLLQACTRASTTPQPRSSGIQSQEAISDSSVEDLISKYSWNLPISRRPPILKPLNDPMTVILTGSTGSLGSYVLQQLLENTNVAHIHCLNRSANSEESQRASNARRGISSPWTPNRVTFHQMDLSQEYLGLRTDIYATLLDNVTHVMHNAWEVNFNLPLSSFEIPHLLGIRQLTDFSARSAKAASIFFISSVSSCMSWPLNNAGPVPERIVEDSSAPLPIGYAESKYAAERLLDNAARIAGVPTTICRVGQVTGPIGVESKHGVWNKQEWLPSLIASSKHLGMIPASLSPSDEIDWIPIDVLSQVLVELLENSLGSAHHDHMEVERGERYIKGPQVAVNDKDCASDRHNKANRSIETGCEVQRSDFGTDLVTSAIRDSPSTATTPNHDSQPPPPPPAPPTNLHPPPKRATVYHALNPHRTTWPTLLPPIVTHFRNSNVHLEIVPLGTWVDKLAASASATTVDEKINANPAVRLLDFYENLVASSRAHPVFETTQTVRSSASLGRLQAVNAEWMAVWLGQWGF